MPRLDNCLHEAAHSVVRQLLIGDLGEAGITKRGAYSYPVERKPLKEIDAETLAKIVVVEAGIVAERTLCSDVGSKSLKKYAISDDVRQREGIQGIAGFSDEQMEHSRGKQRGWSKPTKRPYARRQRKSTAGTNSPVVRSHGS